MIFCFKLFSYWGPLKEQLRFVFLTLYFIAMDIQEYYTLCLTTFKQSHNMFDHNQTINFALIMMQNKIPKQNSLILRV